VSGRQGRWWGPYLISITSIEVEVQGEPQKVSARTFHLPRDPSVPADKTWRAEAVVTVDDVAVAAFGSTEEDALQRLGEQVKNTWEARVGKQRDLPPTLGEHLKVAHPEDVHLNAPWLSIHWDRDHACVHAEFKGFTDSDEFRAGTMKILDAVRDRKAKGLVSDNRGLEGVAQPDQEWLRDVWMPAAVVAGIRRIAVVVAHHGAGKLASEEIIGRFGKTEFVTRTFDSMPTALDWVAQQE
jgi:hypothetical protein